MEYFYYEESENAAAVVKERFANWLGVFCIACIMHRKDAFPWNQYRDLLLFTASMKRKASCIVRKGEKQIQILDGY
jgi:hypothetical protein